MTSFESAFPILNVVWFVFCMFWFISPIGLVSIVLLRDDSHLTNEKLSCLAVVLVFAAWYMMGTFLFMHWYHIQ